MCGDWRRIHQLRGVCSGSPENYWVTRLSIQSRGRRPGMAVSQNRPDRFVKPVWLVWDRRAPESFEVEDTRRDRKACIEAKRSVVAGHPSDGVTMTISQSALCERVS
jgi:hypothetical protein